MKSFKFIALLSIFLLFQTISVNGQEKWNIKLSYGIVRGTDEDAKNIIREHPSVSHFRLETNHNIYDNLYAGCYLGYSGLYKSVLTNNSLAYASTSTNAFFYGINSYCQLLPLFTDKTNLRFEVYPTLKFGLVSELWEEELENSPIFRLEKENNTSIEWGVGLGTSYKFTSKLSIFGEYTLGQFYNNSNSRFHVGLFFNF